jgi:signal peptidase
MPNSNKKKRVGSVIFRIILIVIAGLTVGIGVFSWNAAGLVGNQLPMPFGIGASVVLSPSMEPNLLVNDFVIVAEQESYQVDDIVVYQDGNILVIHRLIQNNGDKVVTKGDANNVADDPIDVSQIKGKMVFRIPFVGLIFKYLKTVPGTLLVLALSIFLLYRSRQKERAKDSEELDDIVKEIQMLRALQNKNNASQQEKPDENSGDDDKPLSSSNYSSKTKSDK